MDFELTALGQVFSCVDNGENFVLQGGAGSGKTESLKRVLEYISITYPEKKVACITHTNLAVDEIKSRVDCDYTICTIHSFLNNLIKNYKKNMHAVISEIFKIKIVTDLKHDEYKKTYTKYASLLYTVTKETLPKVVGKREYDENTDGFNNVLNASIEQLNSKIENIIKDSNYNKVKYNETRFDSFKDLTFSHDSLLQLSSLMFEHFPMLSKIVQDKFDYIFVDEYQDTHEYIVDIFLNRIPKESKTTIGFFGDSMQGIYDDGVGDVEDYIAKNLLKKIEKDDNYRCSEQVVNFVNQLRNDSLKQKVAFKVNGGVKETIDERQGFVKLYYSIYAGDRTAGGAPRNKSEYTSFLEGLIAKIQGIYPDFKKLMLTNKSIASEVGFDNLYNVFNSRYTDVKEEIEKELGRLHLLDLAELSNAFSSKKYNFIITEVKKSGFEINSVNDKKRINNVLNKIIVSDKGAIEVLNLAFASKILRKSDSYLSYINRKDVFLESIGNNAFYKEFKGHYENGGNTFVRMKNKLEDLTEEKFKEYARMWKKEQFYCDLFSNKVKFQEIINYLSYLNEETDYITMHKTKGSGIKNVMVVLDEYFWHKYKFKTIFDSSEEDEEKILYNKKLFYVASSRSIDNLVCIKLIAPEEKDDLLSYFNNHEEIKL